MELSTPIDAYRFPEEGSWEQTADPDTGAKVPIAPFCTEAQSISRARLLRSGDLRKIRLSAAWGNDWPLWENERGPIAPQDLGLTQRLSTGLRAWTDDWIAAADLALNNDEEVEAYLSPTWFTTGNALTKELAIETWPSCDIYPYFWRYHIPR